VPARRAAARENCRRTSFCTGLSMNRTLLDECFRVKGRENWYLTIDEIQRDLDAFMTYYNVERSNQGYRLNGRTPAKALQDALGISDLPNLHFENAAALNHQSNQRRLPTRKPLRIPSPGRPECRVSTELVHKKAGALRRLFLSVSVHPG